MFQEKCIENFGIISLIKRIHSQYLIVRNQEMENVSRKTNCKLQCYLIDA